MIAPRLIARYGILTSMLSVLALATAPGCGGSDTETQSSSGGGSDSGSSSSAAGNGGAGGQGSAFQLSGALSYEYVPYDTSLDLLDYGGIQKRPIRGASVRLLDAATSVEIAKTVSDDMGGYSFDYEAPARVKLWVYTETEEPLITIEDNTSKDEVYVLESAEVDSAPGAKLDVLATTGWGGNSYTGARAAAPFAVLDAVYTAARRFLDEISPAPQFPPLKINWSVNNRPEDGDTEKGQIGTSYWDDEEIYLLGKADVDSDEFDSHVIVHEWGHSFESRISRSDSFGGNHGYGDVLDPRDAWSEGFCNALSAMILDPDTVYADSSGMDQSEGFSFDLEKNDKSAASSPGWYSEETVQAIAFDMYDEANEPFDKVDLGIKGVYEAMIGGHKNTPAQTTIFSFVAALKADNPQAAADIDALVTYHTLNAKFGINAVQDEWATGETHTGGVASALPLYIKASIGGSYVAALTGGNDYNWLSQNRFFQIVGDGQPVTIQSTCSSDVDLYVYRVGKIIEKAEDLTGNEEVTFNTAAGETYVLNVEGYNDKAVSYSADIVIKH